MGSRAKIWLTLQATTERIHDLITRKAPLGEGGSPEPTLEKIENDKRNAY